MKTFTIQPLITEKSIALSSQGIYQFVVPVWVNKRTIAEGVAQQFKVTVEDVKVAKMRGKAMFFKRKPGLQSTYKKASVHLKKGESISEFSLPVEEAQTPMATPAKDETGAQIVGKTESKITVRSKKDRKKDEE